MPDAEAGNGFRFSGVQPDTQSHHPGKRAAGRLFSQQERALPGKKARELLSTLGIEHLADRLPSQVSGGEQQRAAMARALINSPMVLFADEPTGPLNSSAGQTMLEYFSSLKGSEQTIFVVTHDLKAACRGDRILFLRDGRLHGEYAFEDESLSLEKEQLLFAWLTKLDW